MIHDAFDGVSHPPSLDLNHYDCDDYQKYDDT